MDRTRSLHFSCQWPWPCPNDFESRSWQILRSYAILVWSKKYLHTKDKDWTRILHRRTDRRTVNVISNARPRPTHPPNPTHTHIQTSFARELIRKFWTPLQTEKDQIKTDWGFSYVSTALHQILVLLQNLIPQKKV